ncbi:MAG: hypothetical protein HY789_12110, partial [Deltaproteobacteria bacterium]|nr:hypothetical protein [Deltaproteobacteria bacterium]
MGFGQGVEIHVITVPLPADKKMPGPHHLKLPLELHDLAAVFFQGVADKGAAHGMEPLLDQPAPVLAESLAPEVPFVIQQLALQGLALFRLRAMLWGSAPPAGPLAGAGDVKCGHAAKIIRDFPGQLPQLCRQFQLLIPQTDKPGLCSGLQLGGRFFLALLLHRSDR